jgi:hypothetical protein
MSIEAEKFADEAAKRWAPDTQFARKPATESQIALLHKLVDQAPLTSRNASNLIDVLNSVITGKLI